MGSKFMASAYNRFGEPNPKATKYKSGGSVKRDYRDEKEVETVETVLENTKIVPVPQQNIGLMAAQYFGVRSALSQEDGVTVTATYFPYYDRYGNLSGFKKRDWTIPKEQRGHFSVVGIVKANSQMFGQKLCASSNNRKQINVCEGEGDVIAAWQAAYQIQVKGILTNAKAPAKVKQWAKEVQDGIDAVINGGDLAGKPCLPFVGINCGCANAVDTFANNEKFIRSYGTVVLAMDNDAANEVEKQKHVIKGVEATHNIAAFLMADNVYHVEYPGEVNDPDGVKDIRDMLKAKKLEDIVNMFRHPVKYVPDAVSDLEDFSIESLRKKTSNGVDISAEFPKLQKMLKGLHKGTLVMLTGPSGGGKTTVAKKLEHCIARYLMDPTCPKADDYEEDDRLCMIHLEEDPEEAINSLYANQLGFDVKEFVEDPSQFLTDQEHAEIHQSWAKAGKIKVFKHFGSIPVDELITKLKQMVCLYHCRYIVLDHLSMVISGLNVKDERKELDMAMTQLAAFCKQFNVFILVIAHLKRTEIVPPKDKDGNPLPFWYPVRKENLRGSAGLEQLSWVVIGVEAEEMVDRSRGRVRLVGLKNRPAKTLGIADTLVMDPHTGKFHDASNWYWDKEMQMFTDGEGGEVVWRPQAMFEDQEHAVVETPMGKVVADKVVTPTIKPVDTQEDLQYDDPSSDPVPGFEDDETPF
ncbi:AAA family ATPase [Escherichia coli]|nr:AAA family ATPase [Escherichia coli]ELO0316114.1 AAA family ATPase [Escherichia coli O157]QXV84154.1 DNA primase/helicase [Escherichia phage RudolfGeigy]